MGKRKVYFVASFTVLVMVLFVSGCSENEEVDVDGEEEVTLTIGLGNITEEEINSYIGSVQEVYPHFNFELIDSFADLEERVLAGTVPDIILEEPLNLSVQFIELGLEYNMDDLIEQYNVDLSRIRTEFVEGMKEATDRDHMIGIPLHQQPFAILYNKGIFDRFAVPYPEDGMTWDEIGNLAMNLAREEDGVHYYGLDPGPVMWGAYQLGLPWIDLDNMEAVFHQTPEWHELFELWYSLHDRQGMPPEGHDINEAWFNESLAMRHGSPSVIVDTLESAEWMDFDIVTYPENPNVPGVGQRVTNMAMFITSPSDHKEEAMQAISVMISDEVQQEVARFGRMSVLDDPDIHDEYASYLLPDEGGPQNAIAFVQPDIAPVPTFGNVPAHTFAIAAFAELLEGDVDVDTALRQADDAMNQAIQDLLHSE